MTASLGLLAAFLSQNMFIVSDSLLSCSVYATEINDMSC